MRTFYRDSLRTQRFQALITSVFWSQIKKESSLTLFDMGFFESSVMWGGGGHEGPLITTLLLLLSVIMKFDRGNVFYTMVKKICDVTTIM